jgi:hypothetical protein
MEQISAADHMERMKPAGRKAHVCHAMEVFLATRCAPVLMGVKPAAIIPKPDWWDDAMRSLRSAPPGVRFLMFRKGAGRKLLFVYCPRLMEEALRHETARRFLADLGYGEPDDFKASLGFLARRFRESREFPHEIGFFLGYPPEDVVGFIRHRQNGCKLCGAWKVYGDVENARRLFAEYSRCKRALLDHIERGGTIFGSGAPGRLRI